MDKGRQRRTQERAEATKKKLLSVAIAEFSERGYDAVTVRDIEVHAKVQRNLLNYHFGSKEDMWKAAASEIISRHEEFMRPRQELMQDLSGREQAAYVIRSYVRFTAANPEFNRLMIQEGKHESWRLHWLVENFLRPNIAQMREHLKQGIELNTRDFVHWHYIIAGAGSLVFSMAPEAKLLFGVDVTDDAIVDRHASLIAEFLLSNSEE